MRLIIRHLRGRLAEERGFTMATVMAGMLAVMLVSVAAVAAAGGDIGLSRYDQDDKQAYAAAEAGVNDYLGQLNSDSNYWAKCTDVPAPGAVNQRGVAAASRKWRSIPGSTAEYSIELIPVAGDPDGDGVNNNCNTNKPVDSMVDDGNVKIRVTGRVGGRDKNVRTINATFRRAGFLDFLYYTDFENQDPAYINRTLYRDYVSRSTNGATDNIQTWMGEKCQRYWYGSQTDAGGQLGRGQMPEWQGQFNVNPNDPRNPYWYPSPPLSITTNKTITVDGAPEQPPVCGEITFITGDEVRGPFHSNDTILISGSPSFGTPGGNDRVEVAAPDDGTTNAGWRGSGTPTFNTAGGKLKAGAASLKPPETNKSLESLALPGYSFAGDTTIELNGDSMDVTNGGSTVTKALPDNGVIYVDDNGACPEGYNPTRWNTFDSKCGNLRLSGDYSKDLTIGTARDIVVTETVKRTTDTSKALLGLISDGFVRVWHPVDKTAASEPQYSSCTNSGTPTNVRIDAAILTLNGSFTVDNYWCGANLGNLTVNGAIAQDHRGVVGRGSAGYTKKYSYNPELKYRSPPHFLDPIQSSWRILRQGEQSPPCLKTATSCS